MNVLMTLLMLIAGSSIQAAGGNRTPTQSVDQPATAYPVSEDDLQKNAKTTVADAVRLLERSGDPADQLKRRPHGPIGNPEQFFTFENYPPAAIRAGEQGRVVAKLTIGIDGKVTDCITQITSGSYALDDATCQIALRKMTFSPAVDAHGTPIVATWPLSVRWTLPTDAPASFPTLPPNASYSVQLTVDVNGKIETCESEPAMSTIGTTVCLQFPIGRQIMAPPRRDGRPVKAHVSMTTDVATVLDP